MPLLTPGEYDDLPLEAQEALGRVTRQPMKDQKSRAFRRWKGGFMNGDLEADPRSMEQVGFGTGDPKAPLPDPTPSQPPKVSPEG
jgi:hypothetical protein